MVIDRRYFEDELGGSAAKLLGKDEARHRWGRSCLATNTQRRRRFPPPWSVEVTPNCFIVRDANGQQIAVVNSPRGARFLAENGRRAEQRHLARSGYRTLFHRIPLGGIIQPAICRAVVGI